MKVPSWRVGWLSVMLLSAISLASAKEATLIPRTLDLSVTPSQATMSSKHSVSSIQSPLNVHPKLELNTEFILRSAYSQPLPILMESTRDQPSENNPESKQQAPAIEPKSDVPLVTLRSRTILERSKVTPKSFLRETSRLPGNEVTTRTTDEPVPQASSKVTSVHNLSLALPDLNVIATPILRPIAINEHSIIDEGVLVSSAHIQPTLPLIIESEGLNVAEVLSEGDSVDSPNVIRSDVEHFAEQDSMFKHNRYQGVAEAPKPSISVNQQRAITPMVQGMKEE